MVFNPSQKRWKLDIRLEISNCAIERVEDTIFLGMILDENFTRKHDIANVARKISKSIGIINNGQAFVFVILLYVLFSIPWFIFILHIVFQYGHRLIPKNVKCIVILQKKSIRIISKKPFDAQHTDPILGVIRIFANIEVPWYIFVSSWKCCSFLWQINVIS